MLLIDFSGRQLDLPLASYEGTTSFEWGNGCLSLWFRVVVLGVISVLHLPDPVFVRGRGVCRRTRGQIGLSIVFLSSYRVAGGDFGAGAFLQLFLSVPGVFYVFILVVTRVLRFARRMEDVDGRGRVDGVRGWWCGVAARRVCDFGFDVRRRTRCTYWNS